MAELGLWATGTALVHLCACGVSHSSSKKAVETFYQCLRINPEDPIKGRTDLDTWRTLLWAFSLGNEQAHLAPGLYPLWKQARFENIDFEPETLDLLVTLRSHFKLALITNGPSNAQWEKVNYLGAKELFDVILVGGDHPEQKPFPSIFEKVFRSLDVEPHECVMVGDNLTTDILGGINSGLAATVWMPLSGDETDHPEPQPSYTIKNVSELLPILGLPSS
ncbi:hypothetical protein CHUAL_012597 [Chamberlinius hualienensis]